MNAMEVEDLRQENNVLREKLASLEKRLSEQEKRDSLQETLSKLGLADETYFSRRLTEAVRSAERYARFLCVVSVEIPTEGEGIVSPLETAARLREIFRRTDLVGLYQSSGKVVVLLEEAETDQALLALRRVQKELADLPPPRYSMACFPTDTNRDDTLLELLEDRIRQLRLANTQGPAVHFGESIVPLNN